MFIDSKINYLTKYYNIDYFEISIISFHIYFFNLLHTLNFISQSDNGLYKKKYVQGLHSKLRHDLLREYLRCFVGVGYLATSRYT